MSPGMLHGAGIFDGPVDMRESGCRGSPAVPRAGFTRGFARPNVTSWHTSIRGDGSTPRVRTQGHHDVCVNDGGDRALAVTLGTGNVSRTFQPSRLVPSMSGASIISDSIPSSPDQPIPPSTTTMSIASRMEEIVRLVRNSERMAVFTGAGISTESGIPDYRGPDGVWASQRIPSIDTVRTDEESRMMHWRERRARYPEMQAKVPNSGHLALVRFERAGKLLAIVTQNIDGLHLKAGSAPERVIELHGSTHRVRCLSCGRVWSGESIQRRLEAGEPDPRCPVCGGALRVATILFGEALPERELRTAFAVAQACDLMLVVGSSLVVNPAAQIPVIAKQGGAALVIINRTATPIDRLADVAIQAEAGPTLDVIANAVLGGDKGTINGGRAGDDAR